MKLQSAISTLSAFIRAIGSRAVPSGTEGLLGVDLNDLNGKPLPLYHNQTMNAEQYGLPVVVGTDNTASMLRGNRYGGLATTSFYYLFNLYVDSTGLSARTVLSQLSTMTSTISNTDGIVLNSAGNITNGTYLSLCTTRAFSLELNAPLVARYRAKVNQWGVTGTLFDFGFTTATANVTVGYNTSGAYWRGDSTGVMPVLAIGGVIISTGTNISTLINNTTFYTWDVVKDDNSFTFLCVDGSTGVVVSEQILYIPATRAKGIGLEYAYSYIRTQNYAGPPATATTVTIGAWSVFNLDVEAKYTPGEQAAMCGNTNDLSTGTTVTGNIVNSTVSPTVTLSNTTAASSFLDGHVRFAAGAVPGSNTDYILFGYLVPVPYALKTRGIIISAKNLGAAVATVATQIDFFLKSHGTSLSLATTGITTKYIGTQTFPVGSAIGSAAIEGRIVLDISNFPLAINPGNYHRVTARITTGANTASQAIEVYCSVFGDWD